MTLMDFDVNDLELRGPLPSNAVVGGDEHSALHPLLFRVWLACRILQIGSEARYTSMVLLHRYYCGYHELSSNEKRKEKKKGGDDDKETQGIRRIKEPDWKLIGAACLVLGMKQEEEVRRLRDVINVAHVLDFGLHELPNTATNSTAVNHEHINSDATHTQNDEVMDISTSSSFLKDPPELNDQYWVQKERIVTTEQSVLRMLQFDVIVSHPHRLVILLCRLHMSTANAVQQKEAILAAWKRLNDGLFYAPSLQYDCLTLACAAIELESGDHVTIKDIGDKSYNKVTDQCRQDLCKASALLQRAGKQS